MFVGILWLGLSAAHRTPAHATSPLMPSGTAALHVEGNRLVNAAGQPVVLHGVNRMGTEYMCAQGRGIFDGPSDAASIDAIKRWRANAVRVPLNEHCWLGINGVLPEYGGAAYQQAIRDYVSLINQHGLYAILDLHWSAPGSELAQGPRPMPDLDHSPAFWSQVAGVFGGDEMVIFDLFNEPVPDGNQDSEAAWACWRDGGTCPGVPFDVAGMQTLVNAVRATGATNVIAISGVQYGGALTRWREYRPPDPKIVAAWHTYNWTWCAAEPCYESNVGTVALDVPVLATEIGNDRCDAGWMSTLMNWLDGREIGYIAWSWHTFMATDCAAIRLIADYDGAPSQYGEVYRAHLAGLPRAFADFAANVKITPGPGAGDDRVETMGSFMLGTASEGIDPLTEDVRIEVGDHVISLASGAFQRDADGRFIVEDADRTVVFRALDLERFDYWVELRNTDLEAAGATVRIAIAIGNDVGVTSDDPDTP